MFCTNTPPELISTFVLINAHFPTLNLLIFSLKCCELIEYVRPAIHREHLPTEIPCLAILEKRHLFWRKPPPFAVRILRGAFTSSPSDDMLSAGALPEVVLDVCAKGLYELPRGGRGKLSFMQSHACSILTAMVRFLVPQAATASLFPPVVGQYCNHMLCKQ